MGAGVSEFLYYESKFKIEKNYLGGGGGGRRGGGGGGWVGRGEGRGRWMERRISQNQFAPSTSLKLGA